ncbi:M1 family aminopeptidase [Aquimarina brevivitae]|uniref:Putative metalloprotease with PDZ domain n=1 Tax=Aquimarina brevivitae TaxID=323412 RepID=A0A4Q7NU84_9FLAO|nr:M1 family aminopeptidase [Aquimarina brevivitae]RZS90717.1 putative metalloprotease with PDZ domain [Aquimarina brevivitae]
MKSIKTILVAILCCLMLYNCQTNDTDTPLQKNQLIYSVRPMERDGKPLLHITMRLKAGDSGITRMNYQNNAWGEESLFDVLQDMKVLTKDAEITVQPDSSYIEIKHQPGLEELEFSYAVKQDTEGEISNAGRYRPIINKKYFHVFAHNLFMVPERIEDKDTLSVTIQWLDFPNDFVIHNSFGTGQREQHLENLAIEKFHMAIFVGGDFRIYTKKIKDNELVLATRGAWVLFEDQKVMDVLKNTVEAQRNFWADHSQPYFTVTMLPFPMEQGSSFGGTGLTNSFATTVSNNTETSIDQLAYLFNHELMHNWIGAAIKNEKEEAQYWFSEGFTEYLTYKNIAKNSIMQKDERYFIDEMNTLFKNLYTSPVAEQPNSEITYENFWSNKGYEKLPYYRGAVFAFLLDLKIKKESDNVYSLSNVMKDLLAEARQGKKLNASLFITTANKYLNEDMTSFFTKHIEEGQLPNLAKMFTDFNLQYNTEAKIYDKGFAYERDTKIVTNIKENSPVKKAGLQLGDRLKSWNMFTDDLSKQSELTIVRDEEEHVIAYYPVRVEKIPQLIINEYNLQQIKL